METGEGRVRMRAPECWLVFLRVAIGAWFAKALFTKLGVVLVAGFIPLPGASAVNVLKCIEPPLTADSYTRCRA